jgi:hypothetical protein
MSKLEARNVVEKVLEELTEVPPQSEACDRLEAMGMALVKIAGALKDLHTTDKIRVIQAAAAFNGIDIKAY